MLRLVGECTAHERRKEALSIRFRDSCAIVFDTGFNRGAALSRHGAFDVPRPDPNHAGLGAVSNRVRHEIRHDLLDSSWIERGHALRSLEADLDFRPTLLEHRQQGLKLGFDRFMEICRHALDREGRLALDSRLEQIPDELIQTTARLETFSHEAMLLLVESTVPFVLKQASEARDHGNRRAEFMAHQMDEFGASLRLRSELFLEHFDPSAGRRKSRGLICAIGCIPCPCSLAVHPFPIRTPTADRSSRYRRGPVAW